MGVRRDCQGKEPISTRYKAKQQAVYMSRKHGGRYNQYKCKHCGKYHVGHMKHQNSRRKKF